MAFAKALRWLILAVFAACAVFLTVNSFLYTCELTPRETTEYLTDAPWAHLALAAAVVGLGYLLCRRKKRLPEKALRRVNALLAGGMALGLTACVLLSQSTPIFDQLICYNAAYDTSIHVYTHYMDGQYLNYFPFQVPFVLFCAPIASLFGGNTFIAFQLVNVLAILLMVWALGDCAALLAGRRSAETICWVCSFFFFPLWFYATFVYGTLIGGGLMLLGARQLILYLKDHRARRLFGLGLFLTLACLMKMNYLIAVIAAMVLLLLDSVERKRVLPVLASLFILAASVEASPVIVHAMEKYTGGNLSQGFPTSSWVMLGLQEGDRSPGWYNENGYNLYRGTGGDRAETDRLAKEAIRERLNAFARDPAYALSFFCRKTLSQWNESSYQSLWINEMMHNPQRIAPIQSLYERGKLGRAMLWWMDQYQWMTWLGLCLWLVFGWKRASLGELFFPLFFLGGFWFHMAWEGKSQYALVYMFCLIPCAVQGYRALLGRVVALRRSGSPPPRKA